MMYSKLFESLIYAEIDGNQVKTPQYSAGNAYRTYQGDSTPGKASGTNWVPVEKTAPLKKEMIDNAVEQLSDKELNVLRQWHLNPQPDIVIDANAEKAKVNFPNGASKVVNV